jgi:hypothetical protein
MPCGLRTHRGGPLMPEHGLRRAEVTTRARDQNDGPDRFARLPTRRILRTFDTGQANPMGTCLVTTG